jgi:hypothetical protein
MASISNMPDATEAQLVPVNSSETAAHSARTELGRQLREIRRRIVASGQPLLDADELDREVRDRRGDRQAEA